MILVSIFMDKLASKVGRASRGHCKLFSEGVVADWDLNQASVLIEFDRVLHQVKEYLLEDGPVSTGPFWNLIDLEKLNFEVPLLQQMVEWSEEVFDHLEHRWLDQRLKVSKELVHV